MNLLKLFSIAKLHYFLCNSRLRRKNLHILAICTFEVMICDLEYPKI